MKALIISDKQEIIDSLNNYLKDNNYDVIIYRWLLKALDNIEEIHPDLIFLSACEYPRHWKTLASFVQSGIGGDSVKLYLYDPEPLNSDEKEKAEKLGIEAFIDSLSIEELQKIMPSSTAVSTISDKESVSYELILTHPVTGRFIFGKAVSQLDSDLYECKTSAVSKLDINQFIKFVSVYNENDMKAFSAYVQENASDKLVLKVKRYYEEEI